MIERKRILLVAEKGLSKSGVPSLIMSLVRSLSDKYIFDIIVFNNDDYYLNDFLSFGGTLYHVNFAQRKTKISKFFSYLTYTRLITKQIRYVFKYNTYHAIHSFKEDQGFPFLKLAKKEGIAIRITHTNSFQVIKSFKNVIYRIILRHFIKATLKYSTLLIGPSKNVCESFYDKPVDYKVVINPVSQNNLLLADTPESNNPVVITQIGTFSDRKNQLFSIKLVYLLQKAGFNILLNLVGKEVEEGYLSKIKSEIETLGLSSNVSIIDPEIDQDILYKNTHFTFLPSKEEAFGIVAIESQGRGVHCFASSFVPNETNAGNISYLDLDERKWVNQIIKFIEKKQFRRTVGMESFSETFFATTIEKIYHKNK